MPFQSEATQIGKLKQELEKRQDELKEPIQKIQETIGSTCALAGSCFVADTPVHTPRGTTPIEKLAHGRQVITYLPGEAPVQPSESESIDPATWRHIRLSLRQPDGRGADVELLRSLEWIEEHDAHVGGTICLHMPEMGVRGQAEVVAIDACPPLESGEGRLITGTFRHTSGEVYDLKLESESKPIGVTGTHPFWSVDRGNWVAAVDLQVGETLKTLEGTTRVEWLEKRQNDEPVYNIEVAVDHCFRVGELGVLVHNQSVGNSNQGRSSQPQADHVFATGLGSNMTNFANRLDCQWPELAAAFRAARPSTQTAPFNLTVTRNIPRPDQHSIAFGNALHTMNSEIEAFLQTAAQQGGDAARVAHKARLQNAWTALVAAVEDMDVANLVSRSQQNLVSQGRQALLQIKFAIAQVIDAG